MQRVPRNRILVVAGQGPGRLLGGDPKIIDVGQPGGLGPQRRVLPGFGCDLVDLGDPEPQQIGFPRPGLGIGLQLSELGEGIPMSDEMIMVLSTQLQQLRAGEGVEDLTLPR